MKIVPCIYAASSSASFNFNFNHTWVDWVENTPLIYKIKNLLLSTNKDPPKNYAML